MFWHTARDDTMFTSKRCISRNDKTQKPIQVTKGTKIKTKAKVAKSDKKKQSIKKPKAKGLAVLSEVALTKDEQIKATKRSKIDFHISHASGSGDGVDTQSKVPDEQQQKTSGTDEGTGTILGVPDVPINEYESDKESWGDNDEEDGDKDDFKDDVDINDDDSDDNDEKEEEYDDEFNVEEGEKMDEEEDDEVTKELYKDVNVNLRNKYVNVTDADQSGADQQNASQQSEFEQEEKVAHVTLTLVLDIQKTGVYHEITSTTTIHPPHPFFNPLQQEATPTLTPTTLETTTSLLALLDFASISKFNERVTNLERDLSELKQVYQYAQALSSILILPQAISNVATPIIDKNVTKSLEAAILTRSSPQPQSSYEEAATLSDFELTKIHIDKMKKNKSFDVDDYKRELYDVLSLYEAAATLFEFELTKILIDKMEKNKSFDIADYRRELYDALVKSYNTDKDIFESYEEPSHTVEDLGMQQYQEFVMGDNDEQPADVEGTSYWGPKRQSFHGYASNMTSSKDVYSRRRIITVTRLNIMKMYDYGYLEETKVLRDDQKQYTFREEYTGMTLGCWNGQYDFVIFCLISFQGTSYWGPKRQSFHGYASSMTSSKDVYSRKRIITVTRLNIMKMYDYGYLEETEVLRDDQKQYTFREGDFKRLRIQNIDDMLLLLVQQKLTNLTIDKWYDLNVALCMYTRCIIIQRRVEDLQLGVESYQKKLNLTKPDTCRSNFRNKTAYTSYSDPRGIIYVDQCRRKRLMRANELHKFSDGTLNDVRSSLYDIATGIRMEYLPMMK
nr:hypothetical protein [Tanacetum cinerariifolium]